MSAVISPCGTYRYLLTRGDPTSAFWCAVIMLNPSTADANEDDPTIRRLNSFTAAWGYKSFAVGNLYALRSPDPSLLRKHPDPIGPDNDVYLDALAMAPLRVIAWGNNADPKRAREVIGKLTRFNPHLFCLGVTQNGQPKHPLYIPSAQKLMPYPHKASL